MFSGNGSILRRAVAGAATMLAATLSLGLSGTASGDVDTSRAEQQTQTEQQSQAEEKPQKASAEFTPIEHRYWNDPKLRKLLGHPVDTEYHKDGISYQQFKNGWMYHTDDTGTHEVHGAIADRYTEVGTHETYGVPTTDELKTPDGKGRYNHFTGTDAIGIASIYWTPKTGAQGIWGPPRQFWAKNGYERGFLNYPTSTTTDTPDGKGIYTHFRGADRHGASVYWSEKTGAHSVQGAIRAHWLKLGAEKSWLGFPKSNEYGVKNGRRSDFQHGYIVWNSKTGKTKVYRY
ncbi:LGFP repeat-containing protein [Actinopolyspora lacussalsi subsp. righensis]|uniref:LGFP repeat-containing protein n=1 Tax=Actinopolyspora righensis TaxID=995060 RepID=A0A1I7A4Y8_9ACTN|nr:LGFP repeat-containing protein [Actinopolyspora righensis]